MLSFILRRLAFGVFVIFVVIFIVFALIDLAPGDPAISSLGTFATPEQRAAYAIEHGLNDPLPIRYVRFLVAIAHGDLGTSLVRQVPVRDLILRSLPITAQLALLAAGIALLLGGALGVIAAARRDRASDRIIEAATVFGIAAPDFWVGLMAISIFAVQLGWFPSGGFVDISAGFLPWLHALAMPALVLALPIASALARVVRASLNEELSKDYIRTARGIGLHPAVVIGNNGLRNALVSPITAFGLRLGYILGGAIIVEALFNIPGIGGLLLTAVNQGDIAVVQGVAVVNAIIFVVVNLLVDLTYLLVSPKLRTAQS
ncbi:MAG: ABC transporter permease [Hyphomicrobiales bacterium]|nr:MAG: ABC transporter permease [Hyphomicrobiales bacterium]